MYGSNFICFCCRFDRPLVTKWLQSLLELSPQSRTPLVQVYNFNIIEDIPN